MSPTYYSPSYYSPAELSAPGVPGLIDAVARHRHNIDGSIPLTTIDVDQSRQAIIDLTSELRARCRHCHLHYADHGVWEKCLFEPTTFAPIKVPT